MHTPTSELPGNIDTPHPSRTHPVGPTLSAVVNNTPIGWNGGHYSCPDRDLVAAIKQHTTTGKTVTYQRRRFTTNPDTPEGVLAAMVAVDPNTILVDAPPALVAHLARKKH